MKLLRIEPFIQTPEVDFNPVNGEMQLIGKSYPADAIDFFKPIIEWVDEYVKSPANSTRLICEIEYLNSASQKQIVELFLAFKPIQEQGKELLINWKYEEGDDDILSVGELIEHELELTFSYEEF